MCTFSVSKSKTGSGVSVTFSEAEISALESATAANTPSKTSSVTRPTPSSELQNRTSGDAVSEEDFVDGSSWQPVEVLDEEEENRHSRESLTGEEREENASSKAPLEAAKKGEQNGRRRATFAPVESPIKSSASSRRKSTRRASVAASVALSIMMNGDVDLVKRKSVQSGPEPVKVGAKRKSCQLERVEENIALTENCHPEEDERSFNEEEEEREKPKEKKRRGLAGILSPFKKKPKGNSRPSYMQFQSCS